MGSWRNLRHRIEAMLPEHIMLRRVSRKGAPTPATGYYHMHVEQERLLLQCALAPVEVVPPRARAAGRQRVTR